MAIPSPPESQREEFNDPKQAMSNGGQARRRRYWLTTPAGAVAMSKAAAISAFV